MKTKMEKVLLRLSDVADISGLSLATLYGLRSEGGFIEPRKKIGPIPLFDPDEVRRWLKRREGNWRKQPRPRKKK